jgi:hypothetical protein
MSVRPHLDRAALLAAVLLLGSCGGARVERPALPERARASASSEFWTRWGDGQAELSSYRGTISRYGAERPAEAVLIFVTEPLDRDTLVKDDAAPAGRRVQVMKLNTALRFQTGIYPYTVMTSVFAPVDAYFAERFAPAKVTLSVQEWCGHVFTALWPGRAGFTTRELSYFAGEDEREAQVPVPEGALYEDALPIQLRELDGPFAGGGDWEGTLVRSVWRARRDHVPLEPERATITRAADGDLTRFTLRAGDYERTFEVEAAGDRRLLGWRSSDGDDLQIVATACMPYWQLNGPGDEAARERVGLPREVGPGLLPAAGEAPSEGAVAE